MNRRGADRSKSPGTRKISPSESKIRKVKVVSNEVTVRDVSNEGKSIAIESLVPGIVAMCTNRLLSYIQYSTRTGNDYLGFHHEFYSPTLGDSAMDALAITVMLAMSGIQRENNGVKSMITRLQTVAAKTLGFDLNSENFMITLKKNIDDRYLEFQAYRSEDGVMDFVSWLNYWDNDKKFVIMNNGKKELLNMLMLYTGTEMVSEGVAMSKENKIILESVIKKYRETHSVNKLDGSVVAQSIFRFVTQTLMIFTLDHLDVILSAGFSIIIMSLMFYLTVKYMNTSTMLLLAPFATTTMGAAIMYLTSFMVSEKTMTLINKPQEVGNYLNETLSGSTEIIKNDFASLDLNTIPVSICSLYFVLRILIFASDPFISSDVAGPVLFGSMAISGIVMTKLTTYKYQTFGSSNTDDTTIATMVAIISCIGFVLTVWGLIKRKSIKPLPITSAVQPLPVLYATAVGATIHALNILYVGYVDQPLPIPQYGLLIIGSSIDAYTTANIMPSYTNINVTEAESVDNEEVVKLFGTMSLDKLSVKDKDALTKEITFKNANATYNCTFTRDKENNESSEIFKGLYSPTLNFAGQLDVNGIKMTCTKINRVSMPFNITNEMVLGLYESMLTDSRFTDSKLFPFLIRTVMFITSQMMKKILGVKSIYWRMRIVTKIFHVIENVLNKTTPFEIKMVDSGRCEYNVMKTYLQIKKCYFRNPEDVKEDYLLLDITLNNKPLHGCDVIIKYKVYFLIIDSLVENFLNLNNIITEFTEGYNITGDYINHTRGYIHTLRTFFRKLNDLEKPWVNTTTDEFIVKLDLINRELPGAGVATQDIIEKLVNVYKSIAEISFRAIIFNAVCNKQVDRDIIRLFLRSVLKDPLYDETDIDSAIRLTNLYPRAINNTGNAQQIVYNFELDTEIFRKISFFSLFGLLLQYNYLEMTTGLGLRWPLLKMSEIVSIQRLLNLSNDLIMNYTTSA